MYRDNGVGGGNHCEVRDGVMGSLTLRSETSGSEGSRPLKQKTLFKLRHRSKVERVRQCCSVFSILTVYFVCILCRFVISLQPLKCPKAS